MTIDEAIAHAREVASENMDLAQDLYFDDEYDIERNDCLKCVEEHEQLAEWLEEFKLYREIGTVEECKDAVENIERFYRSGFKKAIDDFLEEIFKKYTEEERKQNFKQYCCSIKQELADLAKQLKEGVNNESDC